MWQRDLFLCVISTDASVLSVTIALSAERQLSIKETISSANGNNSEIIENLKLTKRRLLQRNDGDDRKQASPSSHTPNYLHQTSKGQNAVNLVSKEDGQCSTFLVHVYFNQNCNPDMDLLYRQPSTNLYILVAIDSECQIENHRNQGENANTLRRPSKNQHIHSHAAATAAES